MVVVPITTPVTIPVERPTVATPGALLVQVPPPGLNTVTVAPAQTAIGPVMAVGSGFTVTVMVVVQPVPSV